MDYQQIYSQLLNTVNEFFKDSSPEDILKIAIPVGIFLLFVVFTIIVTFIFIGKQKNKFQIKRGLKTSLFLVTFPRPKKEDNNNSKPVEDALKTAEQFYSSLANIKEEKGWEGRLLGNIHFAFEIAVHETEEEIFFYFACPKNYSQSMEKQIMGFWPDAQIQPAKDYSVFNPKGKSFAAEARLSKNKILPLKKMEEFKTDTLSPITSVLTKLKKNEEGAAIQFVFRPAKESIKSKAAKTIELLQKGESLNNALRGKKTKKRSSSATQDSGKQKGIPKAQESEFPQRLSPLQEQTIEAISLKSSQPLFEVNLRIITSAQNKDNAKMILEQIKGAFEQFNSQFLNSIKFKDVSGGSLKKLFYNFSFRIFNPSNSMFLSSGEMASIFHLPSSEILTPNIKWLKAKQAPPPPNLPQEGLLVGKSVFRAQEKKVYMLEEDRLRHFYLIGQTGTGKSALMLEMVKQDIEAGNGVALIDPHGDLAEKALANVPASRSEDVVYFNPSDMELPMGLNMLDFDKDYPESKTFVVNELLEIFEKLYSLKQHGFGGPMFEQYMRNSILLAMEDPASGNTLIEIPKLLADTDFRKYKLSKCKNIVVKNFWEQEAEKAGGEASLANMVPYITSKMNVFIANDMVRPIISQQKSAFKMREIMDNKKILIVNLAKGKLGDTNSFLLGMIIIGKILISAFSRANLPQEERKDFFLYVDEFQNVTTKTISSILAEARKYNLGMIFGHQFIGQLDEETKKAVFGNVGSIAAFRTGPEDAKYLEAQFQPVFNQNDLVNFDNFNAALRLLINGQTSLPFNIEPYPPKEGDLKSAELIKELSRRKYGRDRTLVEEELTKRFKKNFEYDNIK